MLDWLIAGVALTYAVRNWWTADKPEPPTEKDLIGDRVAKRYLEQVQARLQKEYDERIEKQRSSEAKRAEHLEYQNRQRVEERNRRRDEKRSQKAADALLKEFGRVARKNDVALQARMRDARKKRAEELKQFEDQEARNEALGKRMWWWEREEK